MEYQEEPQNYNETLDDIDDFSKNKKSKKTKILIFTEIILFGVVAVLVVIFFANKNSSDSNKATEPEAKNNADIAIEGDVNQAFDADDNINFIEEEIEVREPSATMPYQREKVQPVENLRLSLSVPAQSPVSTEGQIPEGAIVISGLDDGFSPNEFIVEKGEEITLALVSRMQNPVTLTFYNPNMAAVSIGCGPYEARWVTFMAPSEAGEYEFRNDIFGRTNQNGKMIVR